MSAVREMIIPTPLKGREVYWPAPSPMALLCLGKCWSRPGEQSTVIPIVEVHLCFVRHRRACDASVTIWRTSFRDFSRLVQSSSLLPILFFFLKQFSVVCFFFCSSACLLVARILSPYSSYWQDFSVTVQHSTSISVSLTNAVVKSLDSTQRAQGICHLLHVLFCGT